MKRQLLRVIAIVGMALLGAHVAQAADVKFPKDKNPSFSFTMPDNWMSEIEGEFLIVNSPDSDNTVAFSMKIGADDPNPPLDGWHKAIFSTTGVKDTGKTEETVISGRTGVAFFGTATMGREVQDTKLILLKVDNAHVALLLVSTASTIKAAEKQAIDTVVKSVKITN